MGIWRRRGHHGLLYTLEHRRVAGCGYSSIAFQEHPWTGQRKAHRLGDSSLLKVLVQVIPQRRVGRGELGQQPRSVRRTGTIEPLRGLQERPHAQGGLLREEHPRWLQSPGLSPEDSGSGFDPRFVHLAQVYSPKPSGMLTSSSLTRKAHLSVASSMRIWVGLPAP